jgi:riboflavin synthase
MFTGIVSALGRVGAQRPGQIAVEAPEIVAKAEIGGSIAVNGVCLTIVELNGTTFQADVVPETLERTNLGRLKVGAEVNLEPALPLGGPLDGPLVQGHVDATATVEEVREVSLGRELAIALPRELARYVAEKGSIAVDGTSLTVTGVDDARARFTIALIPHTLENTIAGGYRPGSLVNLEVDLVARYLERLVRPSTEPGIK